MIDSASVIQQLSHLISIKSQDSKNKQLSHTRLDLDVGATILSNNIVMDHPSTLRYAWIDIKHSSTALDPSKEFQRKVAPSVLFLSQYSQ